MPRIEIPAPAPVLFRTAVPIRIDDLNHGGHLGNDRVLALAQEVRVQFLRAHGWSELDVCGAGIIMVDAAVTYHAEGRYGMVLDAELGAADLRSRGCDLLYRLVDRESGREVARVKTGIVFFDYRARKVLRMPAPFAAAVGPASSPAP